jgi:uncharacterized protein (TIGR02421 family)
MKKLSAEQLRIVNLSDQLYLAAKNFNVLKQISWDSKIKDQFFKHHAKKLPKPEYILTNQQQALDISKSVRKQLGNSVIDQWFKRQCSAIENTAKMLQSLGTVDFYKYSAKLYGKPQDHLNDESSTSLDLAKTFNKLLEPIKNIDFGAPAPACHLAQTVADKMTIAVREMFHEQAPRVEVVDELSANALAGRERIRIRRQAHFTDKDIAQLIHHEAYIHVATVLNGYNQKYLKVLTSVHPGSAKTQEGLAVFAEFISGSMELDRMRRLSDRVIAIQMAIDGADFIEVYQYFYSQTHNKDQSFENARRVFRGGVITGGAPFTKDIVYLDGLLRIHNFLQVMIKTGRADCLRLLFVGRLDIEDIPALAELHKLGLCQAPKYLPPWAKDMRFLLTYLIYSSFLSKIDMSKVELHYKKMLSTVPEIVLSKSTTYN